MEPTPPEDPTAVHVVLPATTRTMQANRGRDTRPELAIRSALHAQGLRFRVSMPMPFDARRRSDLAFTRVDLHVFIDGCFWHGCPAHFVRPKTNTAFWDEKIGRNRLRDVDTNRRAEATGITVLRFWEHESPARVVEAIVRTYRTLLAEVERH